MDDLISRQDAYQVIDRFLGYLDEDMINRIKCKLEQDCQSAYPRKGKWIKCISQFGWRCSACNQIDKYAYSYTLGEGDYNTLQDYFCPNCGADMR